MNRIETTTAQHLLLFSGLACFSFFLVSFHILHTHVSSASTALFRSFVHPRKRVSARPFSFSPSSCMRTAQMPPAPFSLWPAGSPTEALVTKTVLRLGPPMQGQGRREAVGARYTRIGRSAEEWAVADEAPRSPLGVPQVAPGVHARAIGHLMCVIDGKALIASGPASVGQSVSRSALVQYAHARTHPRPWDVGKDALGVGLDAPARRVVVKGPDLVAGGVGEVGRGAVGAERRAVVVVVI